MTKISKYPIDKDVEKRMIEIFDKTISRLKSKEEIEEFFQDFISPVEKIMLAKRLSIAVLLGKGYKYPTIAQILRVTPSTIASVSLKLKYAGKGYQKMVAKILRDEKIDGFWQKIEDVISETLPPQRGSDWSKWRSEHEREKWKKRKAF